MKKQLVIITLFLWILFSVSSVWASDGPVGMLSSISDQMIASLKAHQTTLKSNPGYVFSLARRLVVPHADLDEMARRVLPPSTWNAASPQQRVQFQREFTTLLIRTYASALAEYKDETVRFMPVRNDSGNTVTVDSEIIRTEGPTIAVSYRLVRKDSGWKLYDMIVEGVSMLESFRSQFSDKLNQENIAQLIVDLREHNAGHGG
ncbi:hypothetical protein AYO45_02615 [Gammaproteobacteria bacterium SCGC AG-212-F23]|nr:hypothetical protein AYO45_02615 [Gammaproteobacteria bacterium SCGC AG-212-F23]